MRSHTKSSYQYIQWAAFLLALLSLNLPQLSFAQRVAPGVPPQHYQQPPPVQQYQQHPQQQVQHAPNVAPQHYQQQQQVQYQQVPAQQQQQQQQPPQYQQPQAQPQFQQQQQPQFQQQQLPQQQQQQHQQVPVQQQPMGANAPHQVHHDHHGQQQVLNTANIEHERAHIQEHMQVPIDTSKMSEQELQFHYFKMHDSDNNNKLDGCELIKSLIHWHVKEEQEKKAEDEEEKPGKIYSDDALSDIVDYVLKQMDSNNDGYVDYAEYRKGEGADNEGDEATNDNH